MKYRPIFRPLVVATGTAALFLPGIVPAASAQSVPWHRRAADHQQERKASKRSRRPFSLRSLWEPWGWDLSTSFLAPVESGASPRTEQPPAFTLASTATAPQPQAAGQDLTVDNNSTYTVSGNEQWANVYVSSNSNGYVVQNAGTTMTISSSLVLGYSTANASGTYTLNSGALSAATEQIGYFANGGGTFTQGGGTNSVGSGGLTLSHASGFGSAYNTGIYNLNGGTLSTPFVAKGGGANGTFNFNGGTLQATGNNGGFMGGLSSANIGSGAVATIDSNGYAVTISQSLSVSGGLTKVGGGSLTLSGASTYTGGTTINAGTLITARSATGNGGVGTFAGGSTVTINSGGTLELAGTDSLGYGSGNASLNINGGLVTTDGTGHTTLNNVTMTGSTLTANGPGDSYGSYFFVGPLVTNASSSTATFNASNGGSVSLAGSVSFNVAKGTVSNGVDLLVSAPLASNGALVKNGAGTLSLTGSNTYSGSTTISAGTLTINGAGTLGGGNYAGGISDAGSFIDNSSAAQTLAGTISGAGAFIQAGPGTLTLTGNNTYTAATTINAGTLAIGGAGTLGGGNYTGGISDAGSFVYNSSAAQTLGGVISGAGTLTQAGPGTLTLSGNNTYSGGTIFAGGRLNVGSAGALGSSGTLSFTGGALQYSSANTTDYSARFSTAANQAYSIDTNGQNVTFNTALSSSGGSLTKLGAGTLTLSGASTYTGGTQVNSGTLLVNNTSGSGTGTGAVTVTGGNTVLGGTGAVSGAVNVTSSAINPGNNAGAAGAASNVGTLNVGALTLDSTSKAVFDLNSGTLYDQLVSSGNVALGGSALNVNVNASGAFSVGQVLDLIHTTGGVLSGTFAGVPNGSLYSAGGDTFTALYTPTDFELVSTVPEPATWLGGALLGLLGAGAWRRQTRRA